MVPSEKELVKKARIVAITMAFFTIVALVSLVYAVYQKTKSEQSEAARLAQESKSAGELEIVATRLEDALAELEQCRQK